MRDFYDRPVSPDRTPALFVAHGNPMNALGRTRFARFLRSWGEALPRPRAILCVSAHWEAPALTAGSAETPATLHDFWGFPDELFALRYPAPGDPALAVRAASLLGAAGMPCGTDAGRGLDHGAWAPLLLLFPRADVPVVQLSLVRRGRLDDLVSVGRALAPLRDEGVLLLGSGNLVHNLATADLHDETPPVEGWAAELDAWIAGRIRARDLDALAAFRERAPHGRLGHPTVEHFAPLLPVLAAAVPDEPVTFPFEGFEHATLSLRCVAVG